MGMLRIEKTKLPIIRSGRGHCSSSTQHTLTHASNIVLRTGAEAFSQVDLEGGEGRKLRSSHVGTRWDDGSDYELREADLLQQVR